MTYSRFISTFLCSLIYCSVSAQQPAVALKIIPTPDKITYAAGAFVFSQQTTIYVEPDQDKTALLFTSLLTKERHYINKIVKKQVKSAAGLKNAIVLISSGLDDIPAEGYKLTVSKDKVIIKGKGAGLLYGIYTFLQLLPAETSGSYKLPCVSITDQPRFEYRGLMIDVARHFCSVEELKKILDVMAMYKLNRFHWHLTDNEGWRIQIKKYPKLTSVGAFRKDISPFGNRELLDGNTYGGFYTQEDIKEVVNYAAKRFITIVPEIEMPAHSYAALRSYPEFKCTVPENSKDPNSYNILYNPSEETFKFLEDVLAEVIPLFPGKYIHVGGDEAFKTPWEESAFTQQLMKDKNLADVHALQSYFIARMEKFVNSKGKNIIGWDEILEGGLAPNATVMSWRGEDGGIASAKQKHNVIMTPANQGLYFDHGQSSSPQELFNIGGLSPLSKVFGYDPVPKTLSDEEKKYIIGVQANLWTEFVGTSAKLEYMLFPRLFGLAEIAWAKPENKDYKKFTEYTLPAHLTTLEKMGVNFRVPEAFNVLDTTMTGSQFTIKLNAPLPSAKIYYTLSGKTPGDAELEYTGPLTFNIPENEKRELQTIVITSTGKRSLVTKTVFENPKSVKK